jgi:hypothetical protein
MKKKILIQQVILGAAIVTCPFFGFNANAQTTSTEIVPTIDGGTSIANSNEATAQKPAPTKLVIKYLGIFNGPGTTFSSAHQADVYGTGSSATSMGLQSRPKLLLQTSENFDFGVETRFLTSFGSQYNKGSDVQFTNGSYRLQADIKNVIKTDTVAVSLIPRIALPTSNAQHQEHMRAAPEMIVNVDYAPKNTRFSFNSGVLYQYGIYGTDTTGAGYTAPSTSVLQPWAETDYQLSPKVQAFVAYWPEYSSKARQGAPLAVDSNEVDLGTYFQVAKGWQIAPYISMEPIGMKNIGQATQLNFYVIGAVL